MTSPETNTKTPSSPPIEVAYTCECEGAPSRAEYLVTSHESLVRAIGAVVLRCSYCPDCAYLASIDWHGEAASIVPAGGGS